MEEVNQSSLGRAYELQEAEITKNNKSFLTPKQTTIIRKRNTKFRLATSMYVCLL